MAMFTGGELVVQTLLRAGVERLFSLHGAHIDAVFQACIDSGLQLIDTRTEAAAGHAAEGYARVGRRLGVALVTAGGGFTNVVTPIANAHLDRTPVLFITGSGALRDAETNTLQAGIDQVAMATPITKWSFRIAATDQIPRILSQAIRICLSPPRGPVLLDIPWDVLTGQTSTDDGAQTLSFGVSTAPNTKIAEILRLLAEADRPVIIVGSEAKRSNSETDLRLLAELTGIPVFADFEGLALLRRVETSCGLVQGLYTFAQADAAPDAVLLLGARFGLNTGHGSGCLLPRTARIAQVDPDARELGRLQSVEVAVASDVGETLKDLTAAARELVWRDRQEWLERCRMLLQARLHHVASRVDDRSPPHAFRAVQAIASYVNDHTIVVADGALTYLWLSEVISDARPYDFLCHGYLGSMGVGMGIAAGAQAAAANEGRRVILVTGDGAVGYGIAEFDTMVRNSLPVVVVILNNRSWGATLHFQQFACGENRVIGTRLENGAYHDAAAAFGANGFAANTIDEFHAAMAIALESGLPSCIDLRVDLQALPPEESILMGENPFK